ncbi:antitoxin VbhA family protein [Actinomyces vulturis]|uniref:antitoxin VbhA family protein n=1 Tax=Actinomyces vulturis TaxID=1857645 RepID=UPI000835AEC3
MRNNNSQDTTTRTQREQAVKFALHNQRMEGLPISEQTLSDVQEYIDGQTTASELVARTRARYGLDDVEC